MSKVKSASLLALAVVGLAHATTSESDDFAAKFKAAYEERKKTSKPAKEGKFTISPDGEFNLSFQDKTAPSGMYDAIEKGILRGTESAVHSAVEERAGSLLGSTYAHLCSAVSTFILRQQYYSTFPDAYDAWLPDGELAFMHDRVSSALNTILYMAASGEPRENVGVSEQAQWSFVVNLIERDFTQIIERFDKALAAYEQVLLHDRAPSEPQRFAGYFVGTLSEREVALLMHCTRGIIDTLDHVVTTLKSIENWHDVSKDEKEYLKSTAQMLNTLFGHLHAYATGSSELVLSRSADA